MLGLFLLMPAMCASSAPPSKGTDLQWVTAYYAGWQYEKLKPEQIDFRALTHLVHFSVLPQADGTLDWQQHGLSEARSKEVVLAAHQAGRKVLLCVGGANTAPGFRGAMNPENRARFVQSLITAVQARGYDGLDIDMEPLEESDTADYSAFIRALRAGLQAVNKSWILTAAVNESPKLFAPLQDEFDQINIMTYDMSGTWEGWETWHNSPLHNGGLRFSSNGKLLPSVETKIQQWLDGGLAAKKLGLGLAFYGFIWRGATGPNQPITRVKAEQIQYAELMRTYYRADRYHWHEAAGVPYLSVQGVDTERAFISFDNERSLQLKVDYARRTGLGGAIIWELGTGYRAEQSAGQRDALLQAVRAAAFSK
jgi:chitinase